MGRTMIRFILMSFLLTTQLMTTTTKSDALEKNTKLFQGKHLVVSVEHFPPDGSVIKRNASGHVIGYSGKLVEQFDWLSKSLGFEYTMIPCDNSTTAPIKSNDTRNSFAVMIEQLIRNEVDASLGPFIVRLERNDIGIGGLMGVAVSMMLVKYPSVEKSIYAAVEPYNYQIWLGIILSLLTISCCSWLIVYINNHFMNLEIRVQRTAIKIFIYFYRVIVQQGGTTYLRITRSVGVLAFTWSLIAIVIVNTYNCSVISHLSANYRKPEVSTFKELAANNDYNMVTVKGSIGEVDVITGVSKALKVVAQKFEKCPECSMEYKPEKLIKKVLEENYVAVLPEATCVALIKQVSSVQSECRLTMGNDRLKYYHMFFGVPKNSPYQQELRKESLWYIAHGFGFFKVQFHEKCSLNYNYKGVHAESAISPIKLKQLFVPFVILICGSSMAFFQFLRELMHSHFERQMTNNQQITMSPSSDPDTSTHHPAEAIIVESRPMPQQHDIAPSFIAVETKVIIEHTSRTAALKVIDISDDSDDDFTPRSTSPYEIKHNVQIHSDILNFVIDNSKESLTDAAPDTSSNPRTITANSNKRLLAQIKTSKWESVKINLTKIASD